VKSTVPVHQVRVIVGPPVTSERIVPGCFGWFCMLQRREKRTDRAMLRSCWGRAALEQLILTSRAHLMSRSESEQSAFDRSQQAAQAASISGVRWRAALPLLITVAALVLAIAASVRLLRYRSAGQPDQAASSTPADARQTAAATPSSDLPEASANTAVAAGTAIPGHTQSLPSGEPTAGQSAPTTPSSTSRTQDPASAAGVPQATAAETPPNRPEGPPLSGTSQPQSSPSTEQVPNAGLAPEGQGLGTTDAGAPQATGTSVAQSTPTTAGRSQDSPSATAASAASSTAAPIGSADGAPQSPAAGAGASARKWAVPSKSELEAAERMIYSVLRNEFVAATDVAKRLALADRLAELASETEDDPAACYALCQTACAIAMQVGDFGRVLAAMDILAARFDVDPYALKGDFIDQLIKTTRRNSPSWTGNLDLIEIALLIAYQAAIDAEAPHVQRLVELAKVVARRTKRDSIVREVNVYERRLDTLLEKAAVAKAAEKKLEVDAGDRAACHLAGCWLCFVLDRWEEGLPLLARGTDAVLATLAADDAKDPTTPDAQSELAERWWQQAERLDPIYRPRAYLRVEYWYKLAAASLSRQQLAVWQPRMVKINLARAAVKPFQYGAVASGNVALASRGAQVTGSSGSTGLIDGVIPAVVGQSGIAQAAWPCQWTVVLPQVYRLREIRLKLPEADKSFQYYVLSTSPDGVTFVPLADHSKVPSGGWQRFVFLSRPVKAIRVRGLFHSGNATFYATELEAYCPPPLSPPEEREEAGATPDTAPPRRTRASSAPTQPGPVRPRGRGRQPLPGRSAAGGPSRTP